MFSTYLEKIQINNLSISIKQRWRKSTCKKIQIDNFRVFQEIIMKKINRQQVTVYFN